MTDQSERCGYCRIKIEGKKVYKDGQAFHHACYMHRQYGVPAVEPGPSHHEPKDQ